ncbi:MAG: transposase zinc-binding domain-containing protein [bacterium]|nr:transposase zinc-binding domain-containing protein [bacterium]
MNILQKIFTNHYEEMKYILHPRQSVLENVEKMIHCGDPSFGGAMFGCSECGELKFVPFRCKSRFCPSCGNMYNQKRSFRISSKLVHCDHRHCVFTIPEELRDFFLNDRTLLFK